MSPHFLYFIAVIAGCFFAPGAAEALGPEEVLVLANRNASESLGLARYYMEKRGIPEENLLVVWVTDKETCTREAYEKKVVPPVKRFLGETKTGSRIRCIVSMYGLPLRIGDPGLTSEENDVLADLAEKKNKIVAALDAHERNTNSGPITGSDPNDSKFSQEQGGNQKQEHNRKQDYSQKHEQNNRKSLEKELSRINGRIKKFKQMHDRVSSFDSELALVKKETYSLKMWIPNPFYLGFTNQELPVEKSEVLMTSRLDGASSEIVKRIINDSIQAEKEGLSGTACFDARWKDPGEKRKKGSGYGFYDQSIHKAALFIAQETGLEVKTDDTKNLFQPGDCPETALYCGWYSLARYVDAFTWQPGSIGYHIASSECATLKSSNSRVWCKKMLDKGISATIGPVGEPYVQSFPVPEIFFRYLIKEGLTLAEAYILSIPYLSWKMVLVGDPLYTPKIK